MPNPFIIMIRLLFQDKQSLDISVSNQVIEAIEPHRGVHEGYCNVYYIFIVYCLFTTSHSTRTPLLED
jgi:hypothetical protein